MVNNYLTGFMANTGVASYNPRYPWLNQKSYNILRQKGNDDEEEMDKYYKNNVKSLINNQKLNDRDLELNQMAYKNATINNWLSNAEWRLTQFSQDLKKKYNLQADANDVELFTDFVWALPDGDKLADSYLWKWDMGLYRAAWLETAEDRLDIWASRATWGRFWLINQQLWRTSILPDWRELINPIWYVTETTDNLANKLADKITFRGTDNVNNLADKVNRLTDKDIEEYRKIYNEMVANKDIRTQVVEWDTIVEQLRDWFTDWINGTQEYWGDEEEFRKRVVQQEANLWEWLTWADDTLNGINSPNVVKFFANMPSSWIRTLTATIRWKTNPLDTIKWLYKLVGTEEWRQILVDRYWSWDAIADLMNYDPVGTSDDILAVVDAVNSATKVWSKWLSKVWVKWLENISKNGLIGNYMPNKLWWPTNTIGSAADAVADTSISKLYGWMDKLAWDNKIAQWVNRYVQDASSISKTVENAKSDLNSIRWKANEWADNIIQNNNRMTKKQQENFKKMSWEDQWKWMNDRNIRTQEDLVDYFLESKNKVDDAMWKIEWQFTSKGLTAVLDDSVDFAKKTENKDLWRLQELQTKNANGWLTMQEINEVKRFYEKNNKFNYLKEWTAEKSALATNRDTALREWQQKIATENGLDNLKELNKETQAAKFLADNATNWQSWIKWNNPISLTDWIVFAWDGINSNSLAWLVSKKIFTAPRFQDKLVDVLNYIGWHETKGEINPNYQAIDMKNYEKRILAEELAKVKSEKEFQAWLNEAQEMAWPALPERIDQWWVVAWDRPFITQNWPTADELWIGTKDIGLDNNQISSKMAVENWDKFQKRLDTAKEIAREIYGSRISDEVAERYAKNIMEWQQWQVIDDPTDWLFDWDRVIWLSQKALDERLESLRE